MKKNESYRIFYSSVHQIHASTLFICDIKCKKYKNETSENIFFSETRISLIANSDNSFLSKNVGKKVFPI